MASAIDLLYRIPDDQLSARERAARRSAPSDGVVAAQSFVQQRLAAARASTHTLDDKPDRDRFGNRRRSASSPAAEPRTFAAFVPGAEPVSLSLAHGGVHDLEDGGARLVVARRDGTDVHVGTWDLNASEISHVRELAKQTRLDRVDLTVSREPDGTTVIGVEPTRLDRAARVQILDDVALAWEQATSGAKAPALRDGADSTPAEPRRFGAGSVASMSDDELAANEGAIWAQLGRKPPTLGHR